ncbi:type II secretion system protein GspM [Pseudomonas gingeri]|uniref:type II secretion system protein GspM n=1 Tax=Pseudomonas gingeri TaxID=117681 RepID=UPI0015A23E44|nr:type II secretion system protein GspM [Pseudomonas gingeri]NWA00391.1 type II secretion system protein M [Pseudomonas gingeri]NWA14895.1 type II secretion system protein M [Pseudomonas gingeri]NWA58023.1 type II secretion system protein M [Pseudomonas gingeri]NWA96879.1 type II secretion system protein M [Pseudomonas gingeri]NWB03801.1 type II secretion system protein M [Pseudomonas gingeri]
MTRRLHIAVPPLLRERWQRLARRERQLLIGLGIFLLAVVLFSGLWQPAQQRLTQAQRLYQHRWALAAEVQRARPATVRSTSSQPLSTRLGETTLAAGLELQQLDQDGQSLRVTISGEALALFGWLDQIERGGALLQTLSLEKRDKLLEARVVWLTD